MMRLDMHCKVYCHWLIGHSKSHPFMNLLKVLADKSQLSDTKLHLFRLCEESGRIGDYLLSCIVWVYLLSCNVWTPPSVAPGSEFPGDVDAVRDANPL